MQIGNIVRSSREGTLYGDVQSTAFWNAKINKELAKGYIFTTAVRTGSGASTEVGSFELLERMIDMFQPGKQTPNRMMAIANYGHGKSHFAVAAANYFGKPVDSEEYRAILESLTHTSENEGRLGQIRAFREARKPYFVVILRGDMPGDLPTLFSKAIESSLASNPETAGFQPPFWFRDADQFLSRLTIDQIAKADHFLAKYELDVPSLRGRIVERDDRQFAVCRDLFRDLYGVLPDFHGAGTLGELVTWLATEISGPGKPFSGTLIIFDELSAFLQPYASGHSQGRHAAPLQDLLNGVRNHPERIGFVALGIQDPRTQMEDTLGAVKSAGIAKELERLEVRVTLRSVLEQVIDAYLKQEEAAWDLLPDNQNLIVKRDLDAAAQMTSRLFRKRYEEVLLWDERKVREQVAWGCYPLHPLTTATFSSITLSASSNPRSVLRFIEDALRSKENGEVIVDGRTNWTRPYELVDYFGEMLTPNIWNQYQSALHQCGGDISDAESKVLKAILLMSATSVSVGALPFATVAAEFTGLTKESADNALKTLASRAVIQHESPPDRYTFFPLGSGAADLERLRKEYAQKLPNHPTRQMVELGIGKLQNQGLITPITSTTKLGPTERWDAGQRFVPFSEITTSFLQSQMKDVHSSPERLETMRGIALWSIPGSDIEVEDGHNRIEAAIDDAYGDTPVPIMVLHPRESAVGLIEALKNVVALEQFSRVDRENVGNERYAQAQKSSLERLYQQIRRYQTSCIGFVPKFARAVAQKNSNPDLLLDSMYKRAFEAGPGAFFPEYKMNSSAFTTALSNVAPALAENALNTNSGLYQSKGPAQTLIKWMQQHWRLISTNYYIQPPTLSDRLRPGWDLLDARIARGKQNVSLNKVVLDLLNAPYGYDERSLMMLVSAWWGTHRHELDLYLRVGRTGVVKKTDLAAALRTEGKGGKLAKPDEFVRMLATATVNRHADLATEADEIVIAVRTRSARYTIEQAREQIEKLVRAKHQYVAHGKENSPKYAEIEQAVSVIEEAQRQATQYETSAKSLSALCDRWQSGTATRELTDAFKKVPGLKAPDLIRIDVQQPDDIRQALLAALEKNVNANASTNEQLSTEADYKINQTRLNNLGIYVKDFPKLLDRVKQALQTLDSNLAELKRQNAQKQADVNAKNALKFMLTSSSTPLVDLQKYLVQLAPLGEGCSDEVKAQLEALRRQIDADIESLRAEIGKFDRELEAASSVQAVERLRTAISIYRPRIVGTPIEQELGAVQSRLTALEAQLRRVEQVQVRSFSSPNDAAANRRILETLAEDPVFKSAQRELIQSRIHLIDNAVAQEQEKAQVWLSDLEQKLEANGNPHGLKRLANEAPAFLDDTGHDRHAQLLAQIEIAVNADLKGKIREEFKQMTDKTEQRELAEMLYEMAFGHRPTDAARVSGQH